MSFRLDRLATLYVIRPLRRAAFHHQPSVPILMYHSISNDTEAGVHPYYRTSTSSQRFATQMRYLHESGYRTATLAEIEGILNEASTTTDKRVVITFDDGYRDFYTEAYPALGKYNFTATMFLPTAYIADSTVRFKGKECLTWEEIRELKRYGIQFGSHTVNHPQLRELNTGAVNREIVHSKLTIEEKLGCVVDTFAYPYAFPQTDEAFKKMLRDSLSRAGYQNGVCTIVGKANRNSEPLFLERLPVNSCDDMPLFAAKLAGAYNWIGTSQYVSKMVKASLRSVLRRAKPSISKDFPIVQ